MHNKKYLFLMFNFTQLIRCKTQYCWNGI